MDELEQLTQCKDHPKTVYASAFHPSGALVATGCAAGRVLIREVEGGKTRHVLEASGRVNSLAFSQDGRLLYAGGPGGFHVWVVETGEPATSPSEVLAGEKIHAFGMHAGSDTLATSGPGGVKIWDLSAGEQTAAFSVGNDRVFPLAISSRGDLVAGGTENGQVLLWSLRSGERMAQVQGHEGGVSGLAFHPDGTVLASGGQDSFIRLWKVAGMPETPGAESEPPEDR